MGAGGAMAQDGMVRQVGRGTALAGASGFAAGRARGWVDRAARHPYRVVSVLCGLCLLFYLSILRVPHSYGLLVGSDGIGYYANLRSIVFDHDLNVSDEYRRLIGSAPVGSNTAKYTVGVAVLWMPFYLAMHLIILALHAAGRPVTPDGYGLPYQFAACFGTIVYGYLGLLLMVRLCREFFDGATTLLATILIFFGWNVVYYYVFENSMSHLLSLFVVAALLVWWRRGPRDRPARYWGGIGLCVGVAAMVRPQDAAFVIVPGIDLGIRLAEAIRARHWMASGRVVRDGLMLCAAAFLGDAPQIAASWVTYGRPFASGYIVKGETFNWTAPHILPVLVSRWHGLFTWHPLTLLAVAGLVFLWRKRPVYAIQLTAALAIQVYVVASWHEWWQGDAFGARMLINCAPILALGLAALIEVARARVGYRPILAVAALALLWNLLFIVQYRLGFISKADPISWREFTVDKVAMLPRLSHALHTFITNHQKFHMRKQ